MSDIVLKVEELSKLYRLGEVGTGTLSHDLNRWWAKLRGKADPYALVGQENDRTQTSGSEYVWSLKDINFEVRKGDVLGIIGKNGAGKSTLLKIISQITSPTTGIIKAKGRIASLLEVGTGMHPEMTARENIYLNGAILGMRRKEIDNKFDEIVDFSGCTMYIDTPVKRFSSGMRVRLGFAVAAFLEPEILIIDEVLAVGDAEFQKKAIGKMQDVSKGGGRTVLFVSHNMAAVKSLCNKCILLKNGTVSAEGDTDTVLNYYILSHNTNQNNITDINRKGSGKCRITSVKLQSSSVDRIEDAVFIGDNISIELKIRRLLDNNSLVNIRIVIGIYNIFDEGFLRFDTSVLNSSIRLFEEETTIVCEVLEKLNIKPDRYYINIAIFEGETLLDYVVNSYNFQIYNADYYNTGRTLDNIELTKVIYNHRWITL